METSQQIIKEWFSKQNLADFDDDNFFEADDWYTSFTMDIKQSHPEASISNKEFSDELREFLTIENHIMVSVEGEQPITLAEFIAINNAEEDNLLTDEDIDSVSKLAIGEHIHVGLSEVKRIS